MFSLFKHRLILFSIYVCIPHYLQLTEPQEISQLAISQSPKPVYLIFGKQLMEEICGIISSDSR